jgi:hypothetical protein
MSAQAYRRHAADCLKVSLGCNRPGGASASQADAIAWASLADDKLTPDEQRRVLDG